MTWLLDDRSTAMFTQKLLAIALAATLLLSGVAGVGAVAAQEAPEQTTDRDAAAGGPPADAGANQSAADEPAADERGADAAPGADDRPGDASERGPPLELPGQVPDHVSQIHATIHGFLGGSVDHLGDALSGFLADAVGDDAAESGDAEDHDDAAEANDGDEDDSAEDDGAADDGADVDDDDSTDE